MVVRVGIRAFFVSFVLHRSISLGLLGERIICVYEKTFASDEKTFLCSCIRSCIRSFVRSFVCLFVRSFVRLLLLSFVCSFAVCSYMHSSDRSFVRLLFVRFCIRAFVRFLLLLRTILFCASCK